MPKTYESIASTTLASPTSSVTFSNIPSIYTDLILVAFGGISATNAVDDFISLRFNGDSGNNYSQTIFLEDVPPGSNRTSNLPQMFLHRCAVGPEATLIVHISSYANTNVFKSVLSAGASPERFRQMISRNSGLWRSTSAINSVTVLEYSGSLLVEGFTASLYGIKAA